MARTKATARRSPGRPRRLERAPEASRQELLDAAYEVFAEKGYGGATIEEIVRRAALSKGTFYWNFANKDAIFLALVEDRIDRPARDAIATIGTAPITSRPSVDLSRMLADLYARERSLVLLLCEFALAAARDTAIAARYRNRQQARRLFLAEVLKARHEQTGVPLTLPAETLAEGFLALGDGLALRAVTDPTAVTDALFGDIASLVYDGMVHRTESSSG